MNMHRPPQHSNNIWGTQKSCGGKYTSIIYYTIIYIYILHYIAYRDHPHISSPNETVTSQPPHRGHSAPTRGDGTDPAEGEATNLAQAGGVEGRTAVGARGRHAVGAVLFDAEEMVFALMILLNILVSWGVHPWQGEDLLNVPASWRKPSIGILGRSLPHI